MEADINFCISYAQGLQDRIDGINYNNVVTEPSQIVGLLQELGAADKHMLFYSIPDYLTTGQTVDDSSENVINAIVVLEKTAYSDISHTDYLQLMQNTLQLARKVKQQLIDDKADYSPTGCDVMKRLIVNSITIKPELHFGGCNGWNIEFMFKQS